MTTENPTPQELAQMRQELETIAAQLESRGDHRAATKADNAANGSRKDVVNAYKHINRSPTGRTYTGPTGPTRNPGSQDYRVEKSSVFVGLVTVAALGAGMLGLTGEARAATSDKVSSPSSSAQTNRGEFHVGKLVFDRTRRIGQK